MSEGWRRRAVPLALVALGSIVVVGVTMLVARHGFGGLYGQDSYSYHGYATGPLRDALIGWRSPPDFGWPPGYPILIALVSLALGNGSLPGQLVSVLAGAVVPVATALLASELRLSPPGSRLPAATPLLAGALVALTPHLWQSSAVVMSDTAALALATLGAWAVVRYMSTGRARWAALAATTIGFAIIVRWIYGLVALPLVVAGLFVAWRAGSSTSGRTTLSHAGLAALAGLLAMSPALVPIAGALASGGPVPFSVALGAHQWDPANALRSSFAGADGRIDFPLPMALFHLLEPARTYYLGPLFASLAVIGGIVVLQRANLARLATLVAWPLLMLAFLAGDTYQNTRFALAILPPLAIVAAVGTGAVAARAWRVAPPRGRWLSAGFAGAVIIGLAAMLSTAVSFTDAFIVRHDAERSAVRQLAAQVPMDARLITFGATLAVRHDGRRDALELHDQAPDALVALVDDARPTYLLVPANGLDSQWLEAPPGRAFAALRDGPGLSEVDHAGAYRLFIVGSPSAAARAYRTG